MKNRLAIFVLLFILTSCQIATMDTSDFCRSVGFHVQSFQSIEADTRTNISDGTNFVWSGNDTVGIYPNEGGQVFFSLNGGEGAQYASFNGGGWAFKSSARYYAYFPFNGDIYLKRDSIPVSYRWQRQNGINTTDHIGPYDFMFTAATLATDDALSFEFMHLNCIIRPRLTLPAGTYTKLSLIIDEPLFTTEGYYSLVDEHPSIVGTKFSNQLDLMLDNVSLSQTTQFLTYVMSAPLDITGKSIRIVVYDNLGNQYSYNKTPSFEYTAGKICGLTCTDYEKKTVDSIIIGGDITTKMENDTENVHF